MNRSHGHQYGNPWPPRFGWFADRFSRVNHYYRLTADGELEVRNIDWARRTLPAEPRLLINLVVVRTDAPNPLLWAHFHALHSICNRTTRERVLQLYRSTTGRPNCTRCTAMLARGR